MNGYEAIIIVGLLLIIIIANERISLLRKRVILEGERLEALQVMVVANHKLICLIHDGIQWTPEDRTCKPSRELNT